MNMSCTIERVRISSFCNVDYHSSCHVNDSQCECNCHSETWTFEDDDDIRNILMRISYDLLMSSNSDPDFIYSLLYKNFQKVGYVIVPAGEDTESMTISLDKLPVMVNICVELNKRSLVDGWGSDFPERLAIEWGVLTDLYPS